MGSGRIRVGITALGAAVVLAACGSSGGSSGVSQSKLETKLKNEPSIQTVLDQGGAKAKVTSQLVDCVAKALVKNADPSDLKKYVNGQMNLNDVGAKAKGSTDTAESEAKTCAQNAVQSDKSSAPAG
jgi:hypothetical protein